MEFSDKIKQFSKRIETIKDSLTTEEATKTALIMPLFQILEYDIFNPLEFVPEFIADVGVKKGEKVDYAILENGKPLILIEAKSINDKLKKHDAQLFRYFTATDAKFAILTNGVTYKFFTDLDEKNKMDDKPFLELNLLDLDETKIAHLKKFAKSRFNINDIFDIASELNYTDLIKAQLSNQLNNPSDEFVRFMIADFYSGIKTANVVEKFRPIVKKSMSQFINDFMSEKLKTLLEANDDIDVGKQNIKKEKINTIPKRQPKENKPTEVNVEINDDILLTNEELEAINIIKSFSQNDINKDDITYKKTENELSINYKNDTSKWICKIILDFSRKSIFLPDEVDGSLEYYMDEVIDINELEEQILLTMKKCSL